MVTRVFALGANPRTSAPLFHAKPKNLREGLKRLKIVKIGDFYFRAERANYIPGTRPEYIPPQPKSYVPDYMPLSEVPGLKFVPPNGQPKRRLLAIPASDFYAAL